MTSITDLGKIELVISNSHQFIIDIFTELKNQNEENLKNLINDYKNNSNNKKLFEGFMPTEKMNELDEDCKDFPASLDKFVEELSNIWLLMKNLENFLNINQNDKLLEKSKELLKVLIKNYNNTINNIHNFSFNPKLNNYINTPNYKTQFETFVNTLKAKETQLKSKKLNFSENDVNNIIIYNPEYFINRDSEVRTLLGTNFLGVLINIIKSVAVNDSINPIADSLMNIINDDTKFDAKKTELNVEINKIKAIKLKTLIEKMPDNEKKYVTITKKLNFNEKLNEIKELLTNVEKIESITNTLSLISLFEIAIYLVNNQKLSVFKDIKTNEEIIINGLNSTKNLDAFLPLLDKIDNLLKYKLLSVDDFKKLQKEKIGEDILKKLEELKTMKDYVNKNIDYKDALEKLQISIVDKWKLKKEFKLLDSKSTKEERINELTEITDIISDLNKFNEKFFFEMNFYTTNLNFIKFKKEDNKCILSNEISKVRYYEDLLVILKELKNPKTKDTEKLIEDMLKGKMDNIKKLNKYKPIIEKIKVYDPNKLPDITEFETKEGIKESIKKMKKEIIPAITQYLSEMKKIGKIIESFRIKEKLK
jgi:hypothetical protein